MTAPTDPADAVLAELGSAGPVSLVSDPNGGTPAGGNPPSAPLTLRQAIQRILFESTLWIPEYAPGSKAADSVDTVLGHASRASGGVRAVLAQVQGDAAALVRIEGKVDALTAAVAALAANAGVTLPTQTVTTATVTAATSGATGSAS